MAKLIKCPRGYTDQELELDEVCEHCLDKLCMDGELIYEIDSGDKQC